MTGVVCILYFKLFSTPSTTKSNYDKLVILFEEEKLTLGQASKLARLHQFEFQKELANQKIPIHYDETDYEAICKPSI